MADKKDFEEWKSLFQKELKGKSPEEMAYQPVPGIKIPPYIPVFKENAPEFSHTHSRFAHSFHIDNASAIWLTKISEQLKGYHIESTIGNINADKDDELTTALYDLMDKNEKTKIRANIKMPLILNFCENDILTRVKNIMTNFEIMGEQNIAIIPGNDFIWNVGLLRGIRKYMNRRFGNGILLQNASIYIPVHDDNIPGNESLLIPFTNLFLSLMVGGINRCIWDIRRASEWQKANLTYLLNVPEILVREGKIMTGEDPIHGSGLFEELSDQVYQRLMH